MKKIITLISVSFFLNISAQELIKNEKTGFYEFSTIKSLETTPDLRINIFENTMKVLGYSNIKKTNKDIMSQNFFSKNILGSAIEVHYNVYIKFKEDAYKLTINSFRIKDVRFGTMPIEELRKSSRKKWIKLINEKLPAIFKNLKSNSDW